MLITTKQNNSKKTVRKKIIPERRTADTRELIIQQTIDIVNEKGMANFRVDLLSSTLGLSPGNITYHFAKKEDLCHAIWVKFYMELRGIEVLISNLMDIKQSFLVVRSIASLIYKYRGVVLYRGSDLVILRGDDAGEYSLSEKLGQITKTMLFHLRNNGYVSKKESEWRVALVENSLLVNLRFWVNKEYLVTRCDKYETINDRISENSVGILYSIYPLLTPQGLAEFDDLCKKLL